MKLLSASNDSKTVKGEKRGYLTGILYLAPASISGTNLCAHASEGCKAACLFTAGRGTFESVYAGRMRKTQWFLEDRESFLTQLNLDIKALKRKAEREGLIPCIRLNGTSDLPWENMVDMAGHGVQFYDYTKNPKRAKDWAAGKMPKNYHVTFSRSEKKDDKFMDVLIAGGNVAVVFGAEKNKRTFDFPTKWEGFKVINGDESDLRFLDPSNSIIGLRAKGKAGADQSGFVVNIDPRYSP